jgi:hypothetical protein
METYNSWPNRETWLVACWLFTRSYGPLMHESRELWRSMRGPSENLRTRRELAKRMRSMVMAAGDAIDGLPRWSLQAVSWDRLVDHFLGGIPDYRSDRNLR